MNTSPGWAMAQRIASWARAGDAPRAYEAVRNVFARSVYPNLYGAHPPFQIDGNFGYTAGVNEMLLQSNATYTAPDGSTHPNYLNVLPALPQAWSTGSVQGLLARGNFTVDLQWTDGKASTVDLTSGAGLPATLYFDGASRATVVDQNGSEVSVTVLDDEHITFDTSKGSTYTITTPLAPFTVALSGPATATDAVRRA
ncbi:glycoside hydrolase family 95-like protein [Cellulosimicrobium cellulans]|uniref:glycoside hydrolase family 95-like protein n=1 Tax=Cellulosimicrobium cellulans TaxID=1710 RepID=UPI0036F0F173